MLRTWIVLISESYKKKATPRAEQTDNIGASGCGQCERVKATLVKSCTLFPCPILIVTCIASMLLDKVVLKLYQEY